MAGGKKQYYLIDDKMLGAIAEVYDFAQAWSEYHINDEKVEEYDDDGNPIMTDAEMLAEKLPVIRELFGRQPYTPPKVTAKKIYTADTESEAVKSYAESVAYRSAERVNPNYKYCVVDSEVGECWLTDDVGKAMEKAKTLSLCGGKTCKSRDWYVLNICKVNDGTYKTFYECIYMDGEYHDKPRYDFLHYFYIARRCGEDIFKI